MKLENYAVNKSGYVDVIWMNELGILSGRYQ